MRVSSKAHRPEPERHQSRNRDGGDGGSDGRTLADGDTRDEDLLTTIKGSQFMGAMGSKVEDVGPDAAREDPGIFEFRASRGVPSLSPSGSISLSAPSGTSRGCTEAEPARLAR